MAIGVCTMARNEWADEFARLRIRRVGDRYGSSAGWLAISIEGLPLAAVIFAVLAHCAGYAIALDARSAG